MRTCMFDMAGIKARGAHNHQERFARIHVQMVDEAIPIDCNGEAL